MAVSVEILDQRLGDLSKASPVARVERLADALELAPGTGMVSALPFTEPSAVAETGSEQSRILTIRNRLHRLGYLESDSGAAVLDESYKSAVLAFQRDAGLVRDRWVGDQTWGALQELVGFEEPLDLNRWYDRTTGRPCRALRRAVQLRLFVLGLARDDPRGSPLPFATALARFGEAAALLGLSEPGDEAAGAERLVPLLFDLDSMTAALGRATGFADAFLSRRKRVRGAWRNAALLMVNAAKVELWLAGYEVDLNDPAPVAETKLFGAGHRRRWQPNEALGTAIDRYWRNRARSGAIAESEATVRQSRSGLLLLQELPAFFQGVAEASADYRQVSDSERSALVAGWYRDHPDQIETSVRHVETLRSRLWDGIKRAWSWIKGLIRDAIDSARKFARDIAAVAHGFASRTFAPAVAAMRAVAGTIATVFSRTLPGSDPASIVITRQRDFDYRLFANLEGEAEASLAIYEPLAESAVRFRRGCEIIGRLIGFVIRAMTVIGTGGFGLFLALIDGFGALADVRRQLEDDAAA